jgi:hypothetical protein
LFELKVRGLTTMRSGSRLAENRCVASFHREIVVAISSQAPDLRGTVRVTDEPDQPFVGWLGLLSALQVAVGPAGQVELEIS